MYFTFRVRTCFPETYLHTKKGISNPGNSAMIFVEVVNWYQGKKTDFHLVKSFIFFPAFQADNGCSSNQP